VELVAMARNDPDTPQRADYDFVAAWRMPDRERVDAFVDAWIRVGFHDYFEQVEARGEAMAPDGLIGALIAL
jgi:Family of unknown function (DUF6616)